MLNNIIAGSVILFFGATLVLGIRHKAIDGWALLWSCLASAAVLLVGWAVGAFQ